MSQSGQKLYVNELIHETSPYLLQHAHNPVDWYPWGEAALDKARHEDKPIFLSIGYSACHWCHVMERESFENEMIANYLNANFVSIKVDREERPDLDDIYMAAVLALNGHGGWPMTVFLTPGLQPFYGGTYYPPQDRHGHPGFYSVLHGVLNAWQHRREEVLKSASQLTAYVNAQLSSVATPDDTAPLPGVATLDQAVADLKSQYDATWGGWGGAPKFPSGMTIGLLLREFRRTGDWQTLDMATHTLDRMAAGGMYDQLGGGFARYSVDEEWLVPHFEKMLYDNAQLSHAYLEAHQLTRQPRYAQVARETLDYVLRDLRDAGGAFHSAEDADSEGEEGKFYIWRKEELIDLLGSGEAALFCRYYGVRDGGNFSSHESYHRGQNMLHLPQPPAVLAAELGITPEALEERLSPMRAALLAARGKRVRPGLDDKVLTSWNGLMISSFCLGAQVLGEPRYAKAAEEAATFLLRQQWKGGTLLRTHRHGESRLPGYLDDYAFFANALVDLYETTFEPHWLEDARAIVDAMLGKFWDDSTGAFFFTGEEHKHLITRARPSYDGAEPSGNSVAVMALYRLGTLCDAPELTRCAERVLNACAPLLERAPRGYLKLCWGLHWHHVPPVEIVVAANNADPAPALQALRTAFIPNKIVAMAPGPLPLLEGKAAPDGEVAVFFCRNHTCERPLTSQAELEAYLAGRHPPAV